MTNNKGYTLVELIVTFALTALFISSATLVLTTHMKLSTHMRDLSQQQILADTLLNDMENKLSNCVKDRPNITEGDEIDKIHFLDINYYPTDITVNTDEYRKGEHIGNEVSGAVVLYIYDKVKPSDESAPESSHDYVYWAYPSATYTNNEVTGLKIEFVGESDKVVVKITLKLKNQRTGAIYTDIRYAECYNLE